MKTFTKFSLPALFFFLIILASNAQDVGVTAITGPVPGTTLQVGVDSILRFTVKNFGTTAFNPNDTLRMQYTIEGNAPAGLIYIFSSTFASGSSINLYTVNPVKFPLQTGTRQVCVATIYAGDANTANDKYCGYYNMVSGPVGLQNLKPSFNSIIKNQQTISINLLIPGNEEILELKVFNVLGQLLYSDMIQCFGNQEVNTSFQLPATAEGILIVAIYNRNGKLLTSIKI